MLSVDVERPRQRSPRMNMLKWRLVDTVCGHGVLHSYATRTLLLQADRKGKGRALLEGREWKDGWDPPTISSSPPLFPLIWAPSPVSENGHRTIIQVVGLFQLLRLQWFSSSVAALYVFFFVLRAMCQPSISSNSSCRLPNYIIFLFLCRSLYKSLAVYCKARWARTMRLQVLSPVTILLYPLLLTRVPSPGLRVCTRLRTVVVLRFIRFIDVHSTDCSLFFPFFLTNCTRHCLCWTGRTVIKKVRFL